MLSGKNIYENGSEVLIFKDIKGRYDIDNFIKGTIISSEISNNLSNNDSSLNVIKYKVIDEEGRIYIDTIGEYDSFIMTKESYIDYLNNKIRDNNKAIKRKNRETRELNQQNEELEDLIKYVQKIENTTTKSSGKPKVLSKRK